MTVCPFPPYLECPLCSEANRVLPSSRSKARKEARRLLKEAPSPDGVITLHETSKSNRVSSCVSFRTNGNTQKGFASSQTPNRHGALDLMHNCATPHRLGARKGPKGFLEHLSRPQLVFCFVCMLIRADCALKSSEPWHSKRDSNFIYCTLMVDSRRKPCALGSCHTRRVESRVPPVHSKFSNCGSQHNPTQTGCLQYGRRGS